MTELPSALSGLTPTQVGILVPDLEEGIRNYSAVLGLDDWLIYTYSRDSVPDLIYRGDPADCSFRLAMAGSGPQIELIQPLGGKSVYTEWIEARGYGLQHLGFHVPSMKTLTKRLEQEGILPVQSGSGYGLDGDGAFAYFDTVDSMHLMLELIELPARRRPTERIE